VPRPAVIRDDRVDLAVPPDERVVADLALARLEPREAALLVRRGVRVKDDDLDGLRPAGVVIRARVRAAHGLFSLEDAPPSPSAASRPAVMRGSVRLNAPVLPVADLICPASNTPIV